MIYILDKFPKHAKAKTTEKSMVYKNTDIYVVANIFVQSVPRHLSW